MQKSDTVELVRQMRQALASMQSVQFSSQTVTQRQYEATKAGCEKAIAAADQWLAEQSAPAISTEHGPWLESTLHEGETYCKRCLTRSIFATYRECDPHIEEKDTEHQNTAG